jgi:hAT family C-terminal dimerisation region
MTLAMSCDNDDSSTSATAHGSSSSAWLEEKKARKASKSIRASDAEALAKELDDYIDLPCEPQDNNPFQWWATNQKKFPNIADVARAHLGIPATSVASERVFSKCGLVCSDRRASLKPQHVEHLVFLSHNLAGE